MKFNVGAFALAFGLWWGVGMFIMTWWLIWFGTGAPLPVLSQVYIGYTVTPVGSLIGLAWGFFCGLICGGIFAWLYNFLTAWLGGGETRA